MCTLTKLRFKVSFNIDQTRRRTMFKQLTTVTQIFCVGVLVGSLWRPVSVNDGLNIDIGHFSGQAQASDDFDFEGEGYSQKSRDEMTALIKKANKG